MDSFDYRSKIYKDIINEIELKKSCMEYLSGANISYVEEDFKQLNSIQQISNYMIHQKQVSLSNFNELYLEVLTYSCSNIFLEKTSTKLSDEEIEKGFKRIITEINKEVVTVEQYELMEEHGYNLLDYVSTRDDNKLVFPVLKYDVSKIELFCIVQFTDDTKRRFKACTIRVNRRNNNVTFYMNGTIGKFVIDNYKGKSFSGSKIYMPFLRDFLKKFLGIHFISENIGYQEDKEKLFLFCQNISNALINDYAEELEAEFESFIDRQISNAFGKLKRINTNVKVDKKSRKTVYDKIFNTYLGLYITNGYTEIDLKEKALKKGIPCYPTSIFFTGQELAKGKAKSSDKKVPLAFENVFYSLKTDFTNSKKLEEVTIAWFDKSFFNEKNEMSASQTTIKIKKKYFLITMNNSVNKNKRMTRFVENTIREILE